jgi:hypothetical protein
VNVFHPVGTETVGTVVVVVLVSAEPQAEAPMMKITTAANRHMAAI